MAAVNPPVNGVAYIVYVALQDMANPGSYKANPAIAAGDWKVTTDGGALANLTTLPTNTPAGSVWVKLSFSAGEMTGDNVGVQYIDQTNPKECADFAFNIQTVAAVWLTPTTPGRALDVSAGGEAGIDWANVGSPTTALNLSGTNIDVDQVVASVSGAVGSVTGAVGSVTGAVGSVTGAVGSVTGNVGGNVTGSIGSLATQAKADVNTEADTALSDVGVTSTITGRIDAAISTRASQASVDTVDDFLDTEIAAIKSKTDNLPSDPADASDVAGAFSTVNTTLGTIAGYIDTEVASILTAVDTEIAAIKAKTDNLPASPAAVGSAMTLAAGSITSAVVDTGAIDADALATDVINDIWAGSALTESYAADGAAATPAQLLYAILQRLTEFSISGTTITVKKLDGSTTALTLTMDSATTPTSSTRAS